MPLSLCSNCDQSCLIKLNCSNEWIEFANQHKRTVTFSKGQTILHEGMPVDAVTFIRKGKVKVFKTGNHGKSHIVRLSNSGDMLGHRGFNQKVMPVSAVALETCKICFFDINNFVYIIKNNPEFSYKLLLFYSDELNDSEVMTQNHAQMNVRERIADSLVRIFNVYGECKNEKCLDILLSRQDIADIAGTTKEQVSKYLYEFQEEKTLLIKGKKIVILELDDLKRLI
jgi:CRP/FNR family transcriptional regulator, anaerobic regulatory protein